jgi:Family of unknown function (DUF6166)
METMTILLSGEWETKKVWLAGIPLDPGPSQKVWNHSPDGFAWGYGGSGPAQLALAVLLKFTDARTAVENYQAFKWEIIFQLDQADFEVEINLNPWLEPRLKEGIQ